ncbi:type II toxin-antitoxin system RelE/ParE family toxin [Paenibacillus tyrfis]|uniref:type II toxin-antitoxin system RelE/ParE family toxin n=1 Tax=Paenibacillus tyrfis TaxID=1501230 RepID=UPI0035CCCE1F
MPPKSRVRYIPAAVDDLDEIFSYITQDNWQNAEKMLEKLNREIGGLADFSHMGSIVRG